MVDQLEVFLKIRPVAKERPRSSRGHFYTPKRTREYEDAVRLAAARALQAANASPFMGPVILFVETVNAVPKSWPKDRKAAALAQRIYPNKGDLDNRVKAISDALNGVFYVDDVQIVRSVATMRYGEQDSIHAVVYKITGEGSDHEEDNKSGDKVGRARDTSIPMRG